MTKYVECWGADKPFANIAEATLAKNIGLTVSCYLLLIQIIFIKLLKIAPLLFLDRASQ